MNVLLKKRLVEKIVSIKRLRDAVPGLGLREAKEICERLPFEVLLSAQYVNQLDGAFEYEINTTYTEDQLQAKWDALPKARRLVILQLLDSQHRLD